MIPKPFKHPSIDLNRSDRQWVDTVVHKLSVGDNLLGYGVITDIDANLFDCTIAVANGQVHSFTHDSECRAFTVVR